MIKGEENQIVGNWIDAHDCVTKDPVCERIEMLIREYLQIVADAGWERLLKDPSDGRLWELTYPQSEMHAGGPPKLTVMAEAEAKQKYRL